MKNVLKEYSFGIIVDYEEWRDFYDILSLIDRYGFGKMNVFKDDGSYGAPSCQYFEILNDRYYFSPYDLAKALKLI